MSNPVALPNILGLAGYSGSGKTTLLEKIIPLFVARGLRIAVVKHAHHDFDMDQPGKDSYRHRQAGASQVLIASANRWALLHELKNGSDPTLEECVSRLSPCDLVLVEGYKHAQIPKLEVHRSSAVHPYLHPADSRIFAVATDQKIALPVPVLDLNAPAAIAAYIINHYSLHPSLKDAA